MINEQTIASFFSVVACAGSLATWVGILIGEWKTQERNYYIILYAALGVFLSGWFGVGFFILLIQQPLQTSIFFRPLFPVLLMLYTGGGVLVHRNRLNQQTIIRQKQIIAQFQEERQRVDELEKRNEKV